jgi:hypothetical protein
VDQPVGGRQQRRAPRERLAEQGRIDSPCAPDALDDGRLAGLAHIQRLDRGTLVVILLSGQLAPGVVFRLDRVEVAYGIAVVLPLLVEDHVQAGEGGLRVFGIVRVLARCGQLR